MLGVINTGELVLQFWEQQSSNIFASACCFRPLKFNDICMYVSFIRLPISTAQTKIQSWSFRKILHSGISKQWFSVFPDGRRVILPTLAFELSLSVSLNGNHHALCFYDVIETRDLRNVRRQYYEYSQHPRHSYIYFQTRADKNLLINLKSQLNFAKVISCFGLIWFVVCTRRATNTRRYPVNGFPLFSLAANSSSLSCL